MPQLSSLKSIRYAVRSATTGTAMLPIALPSSSRTTRNSAAIAMAVGTLLVGSAVHAAVPKRVVALTGAAIPDYAGSTAAAITAGQSFGTIGTTASAYDGVFTTPVANAAGKIAFNGSIAAATGITLGTNDRGLFSEGNGPLSMISRRADNAVDAAGTITTGTTFGSTALGPNLNSNGTVVFTQNLAGTGITTTGTSSNNNATFVSSAGVTKKIVQLNDAATVAGSPVVIRSVGSMPAINSSGQVVMHWGVYASGSSSTSVNSVWRYETDGSLLKIAAAGEAAPGTDIGSGSATFSPTSWSFTPSINATGMTAFMATLTTGANGVTSTNSRGIWVSDASGVPALLTRTSFAAPGTVDGVFSSLAAAVNINDAGTVVFSGTLAVAGSVTSANDTGIWRGSNAANVSLVAREGSQAAGLPAGVNYATLNAPIIGHTGNVAFATTIAGAGITTSNDSVLYTERSSGLQVLAQEGSTAATTGKLFGPLSSVTKLSLNDSGSLAFLSTLTDTLGGSATATALFAEDPNGVLKLVAQTGTSFEISPGVFKTVSTINFNDISITASGGDDGRASGWTDAHTIAFSLRFDDNSSGVFLVAVPEPASLAAAVALGSLALRRRRCSAARTLR